MIQVQVNITVDETGGQFRNEIHILAREDANEHERGIALAVENVVLTLHRAVVAHSGDEVENYTEQLIGPQHVEEQQRRALERVARAAMALNDGLEGENALYASFKYALAKAITDLPDDLERELRSQL